MRPVSAVWALALSFGTSAHAADPIDLDAAVARALEVGVSATEARLAVDAATVTLNTRRHAAHPDLTLGVSSTVSLGRTFSEALGENVTEPAANAGARITSRVPLYAGGAFRAARVAAEASLDARLATVDQTRQDLTYTLATSLLDLGEARGAVRVTEASVAAEEALRTRIAAFVDAGARTRADLLQQDAALAAARADLVEARRLVGQAELALVGMLRLDPSRAWEFTPPESGPAFPSQVDAVVGRALGTRPDLVAYQHTIDASAADVRAARAGGLPSLDLTMGAKSSWLSQDGSSLSGQLRDQASAWATLDLSIPIFDRGLTRDNVAQARIAERSAQLDLAAARDSLIVDVRGALLDREAATTSLAAAESRAAASEAAVRVLQDRYDAGAASLSEVLVARAAAVAADRGLVTARTTAVRADYALGWVVGEL